MAGPIAACTKETSMHLLPDLGRRTLIMGILNVTPDSFSDGGDFAGLEAALAHAAVLRDEGADIIDIGGESTRPTATPVATEDEIARVEPVIRALAPAIGVPISIDTYKAATAEAALAAGATIVNDIWGLQREPEIARVAAAHGAPVVVMHNRTTIDGSLDIIEDMKAFFARSITIAQAAGIADDHIILDPGVGFGKTFEQHIEAIARLDELRPLGYPLLVACDVYRPAAIQQLETVGRQLDIPVFQMGQGDPVEIAKAGIEHAKKHGNDLVFLDTAGRLHIDEALMTELQNIKAAVNPAEILLVIDAMIGQDAVATAQAFDDALDITGVMLTKLDGDARGGAALSIKALTGKPIKFAGIGEKLDQIEPFHPDRMASRILGMGDVLTLIEKAEQNLDQKKAEEMAERLRQNRFTLTDYYDQLQQIKGMGSLQDIAGMIPGMDAKALSGANVDEKAMGRIEAIIQSMTPGERDNPAILNSSRKKRIAAGAGTSVVEINKLLKQFELMQQLVRQMSGNSKAMKRMKRGGRGGFGGLGNLFGGGGRPYGF